MKLSELKVEKIRFELPVWSDGEMLGTIEFYNPTKELTDELEEKIISGQEITDDYKINLLKELTNLEIDMNSTELFNGLYNEILDRVFIEIDQIILDVSANVLLRLNNFSNMSDEKKEAVSNMAEGLTKEQVIEHIENTKRQIEILEEEASENQKENN